MMEIASYNIWCWIIPAVVGLLCAYFGFLIGKGKDKSAALAAEIQRLNVANNKLQSELAACLEKGSAESTGSAVKEIPFDAQAAKNAFGKRVKQDDLKLVEGIGPKIEGLFHNFDIKTWKALSETPVAKCQEVLDSGGDRYKVHDPASWPMQAKMADEGKWKALFKWQVQHKHGKL
jgi:predicted flap endonuclease-1-like 5' DNA nuclease